ncbi:MAG: hypothetical protein JO058_05345 [Alphaproteobacteria bacterium]|nr:hypothetical protein [Alphaproteobacteria bacterium]MBV9151929.1 hypothetical protein [Alphaproteobacteria bacterium]MBV9967005.1 hypothetical protein [Alphaproteobacteria bacterium]
MPRDEAHSEPTICPKCGTADVRYRSGCSEPGLFLVCRGCDYNEEFTERPQLSRSSLVAPTRAIRVESSPRDDLVLEMLTRKRAGHNPIGS